MARNEVERGVENERRSSVTSRPRRRRGATQLLLNGFADVLEKPVQPALESSVGEIGTQLATSRGDAVVRAALSTPWRSSSSIEGTTSVLSWRCAAPRRAKAFWSSASGSFGAAEN
jgi:hypothetical protein